MKPEREMARIEHEAASPLAQKEHGKDGPVPKATGMPPMTGQSKPVNVEPKHTSGSVGGNVPHSFKSAKHAGGSGHPGAHRLGRK